MFLNLDFDGATSKLAERFQTQLEKFDKQMKVFSKKIEETTISFKGRILCYQYVDLFVFL